jgi:phenylacetate-CoA ligase
MYSTYHLNKETVGYYHSDMLKRNFEWLTGYPSTLSLLASLIKEEGLKPIQSVKWITTGAENLLEHQIQIIKQTFPNAMVRTHYGLTEGVANFSQTIEGKWHIDEEFAYAEFIPIDDASPSVCRIIGTGFSNKAFPLIRYDTGDLAKVKWSDGKPEIIEIFGRQEDYVELPNGVKLGRLDHIFKDCVNIREAQIHQIRKDLIELRIVKDVKYAAKDEQLLIEEASSRFGKDVELKISYCDAIERTKAGKVRFVVSELYKIQMRNYQGITPPVSG